MIFRLGQRSSVPEPPSRTAARVVSSKKSAMKAGMPLSGSSPYKCDGCTNTTALRLLSSSKRGIEDPLAEIDTVAVGQKHDAIGVGRKRSIQILEFFDRVGFTRRTANARVLRVDSSWHDED